MNSPVTASRSRADIWWLAMFGGALFLPPIKLDFTPTSRSKLLSGAIVALAYLAWRLTFCRFGFFNISTFRRALPILIAGYVSLQSIYLALAGKPVIALIEMQWVVYLLAPILMLWDLEPARFQTVTRMLLACLGVEAILAAISSFTGPMYEYVVLWYGPRFGTNVYRAVGTMDSTNSLGGLMAFGALVSFFAPKSLLPAPRIILAACLACAVVLSQSKSAFFSVIIVYIAVSIFSFGWRRFALRKLLSTAGMQLLVLAGAGVVFSLYGDAVLDNISTDYVDRTALSERALSNIAEYDWAELLLGRGFHGVDFINPNTGAWITAHNSYINLLADLGIIGSLLMATLFIVLLWTLAADREWHLLAGMLGLVLHFVTEAFLYAPLFVMTLGTVYAISCVHRSRRRYLISEVHWNPSRIRAMAP